MNQIKGEKIDRIVKSKIEVLNFSPPQGGNWDKSVSWKIIRNKLNNSNRTLVIWGLSMAASISMLIAANVSWEINLPFDLRQTVQDQTSVLKFPEPNTIKKQPDLEEIIEIKGIETAYSKNVTSTIQSVSPNLVIKPVHQPATPPGLLTKEPPFNPYFSMHTGTSGSYPTIGLDIKLYSKRKNNILHLMTLGAATGFQRINVETSNKVFPLTYINVGYARINHFTDKGWSTQLGYMINPDSNVYKNKTVRFSMTKRLSRHIKVGPEIIFTNNLKKVYPGISIVLS